MTLTFPEIDRALSRSKIDLIRSRKEQTKPKLANFSFGNLKVGSNPIRSLVSAGFPMSRFFLTLGPYENSLKRPMVEGMQTLASAYLAKMTGTATEPMTWRSD